MDVEVVVRVLHDPAGRLELGQHDRGQLELVHQLAAPRSGVGAGEHPAQLGELALAGGLGGPRRLRPGQRDAVSASISSRWRGGEPGRAQQPQRVLARRRASETARSARASASARPPVGSIGSPPASGIAIALTVKSRAPRSALDRLGAERGRRRRASRRRRQPTARQVACRSESGKAEPPAPRAIARAASSSPPGRPRGRRRRPAPPSSASRTAPPTIQASLGAVERPARGGDRGRGRQQLLQ